MARTILEPSELLLRCGGRCGDLIRAKDWAATSLGPMREWPPELLSTVQMILSSTVPMTVVWGAEGLLIYNDGYAEVCGPRHPASLGGSVLEIWPEASEFNARVVAAGMAGEPLSFHAQELELWRTGRPERVWMDLEYTPLRHADGQPAGMLAMVFDITRRVEAERALGRSEELFRFLDSLNQAVTPLQDADQIMAVTTRMVAQHLSISNCAYADMDEDEDGFTIRGNWHAPGSPSILGHYSLATFGELAVDELKAGRPLIINDNLAEIAPHEAQAFQAIGVAATICMPLLKNGRLRALMAIHDKAPHRWGEDELTVIREVTQRSWAHIERVGAQSNLRSSEEQLRLAVEAAEIGLWDVDEVNSTLFWPPRVKAMFGISPDSPVSMEDYYSGLHPDDFEATAAAYAAAADPARRAIYDVEYRTIGKEDGVLRWVAAKGRGVFDGDTCLRVIGTAIDITQRKQTEQALKHLNETLEERIAAALAERDAEQRRLAEAEEQLRQAQKVEALGQLTGGVAHDFNNLLTPIIGSLDYLTRKQLGTDRERQLIGGALHSAERARTLVQRLLAFARRQPLQPTAIDIGTLISGMAELIESTTGPQVRVIVEAPADLQPARADYNQVEMALLNLTVNARDAMPDGGTLRISATPRAAADSDADVAPGDYIVISVADTGVGMDAETLARAIEPFFSTKGIGRGTGLGLSMVHGLARQLGGGMRLFSRPGVGTNVEIWLPQAAEPVPAATDSRGLPADGATHRGRALLVDDEEMVRASTAYMLDELGYAVVEASSGEEAEGLLRASNDFAVLVTDHLMSNMSGVELVHRARLIRPDLPALIVSGYADVDGIAADMPRLTKPFRAEELAAAIAALS